MPRLVALALATVLLFFMTHAAQADYARQVQVFYDAQTGETRREVVLLADPDPDSVLAFRFYPARHNTAPLDAQGRAQGEGRVIWRIEGLSAHDPRAWHHSYEGELKAGRLHGEGVLRWRDGREWRGSFRTGRLDGTGSVRDAHGDVIEATFAEGQAQGEGVFRARAGWVWRGPFVNGVMQGAGEMTEAGGRRYSMVMEQGHPASGVPETLAAHPLIAGLRPVQSGASMADRAELSVFVDQRMSANQWAGYYSRVEGDQVIIQPSEQGMIDLWNGEGSWEVKWMLEESLDADWDDTRALTLFEMQTSDGSRVTLDELSLNVSQSLPHLRPVLIVDEYIGCHVQDPAFGLINHGWGKVDNPRLRIRFANGGDIHPDDVSLTSRASRWVDVAMQGLDATGEVDLRAALRSMNVALERLASSNFQCPSQEMLSACGQAATASGDFGEIAATIGVNSLGLMTTWALGELTYDWVDYFGDVHTETFNFSVPISLALMDVPASLAECGAGGAWPTEAQQFHDVILPVGQMDYSIALPWRGNPTMSDFLYGAKFHAERTSLHIFQVQARFSDGSIRLSPETMLFFVNPRRPDILPRQFGKDCTAPREISMGC